MHDRSFFVILKTHIFMKITTSLVVIADSQEARIFEKIGNKKFELNFIHKIEAELDSNHEKPGRTFNNTGSVRHAIEPHTDRREVEKHHFAEKISKSLFEMEKSKQFEGLVLVVPHKMLEEMDKTLTDHLREKITHKLTKNLMEFSNAEIKEYLEKNLE